MPKWPIVMDQGGTLQMKVGTLKFHVKRMIIFSCKHTKKIIQLALIDPLNATDVSDVYIRPKTVIQRPWTYICVQKVFQRPWTYIYVLMNAFFNFTRSFASFYCGS